MTNFKENSILTDRSDNVSRRKITFNPSHITQADQNKILESDNHSYMMQTTITNFDAYRSDCHSMQGSRSPNHFEKKRNEFANTKIFTQLCHNEDMDRKSKTCHVCDKSVPNES